MEIKHVGQISSLLRSFRPSFLYFTAVLLLLSLALTSFLCSGFSPFTFTILVLITSTILITLAKKRNSLADQNAEDVNMLELESEERLCLDELGCDSQEKPAQQSETGQPRDLTSELELSCVMVNENANDQSPVSSDGSSDDDENDDGLIEIALPIPDGDFVDSSEESDRESHSNSRDILPEAGFQQESLMELLAEINEEENLFEIDISPFYDPSNVHDLRLKHD